MCKFPVVLVKSAFAAATLMVVASAHAYFVRPYVQIGQGVIDGYVANGPTQSSQNFTTAAQASVDLSTGTTRNYLQVTGPGAFAQSAGIFGDRLTFMGAAGTTLNFSFAFDGTVQSPARDPNLNSSLLIGGFAGLYIFDPSAGATYQNFNTLPGALASQSTSFNFNNPTMDVNAYVSQLLSAPYFVPTSSILPVTVDIFAFLSIYVSPNNNPVTVTMNFLNTGTFGIDAAPGVTFTSESGVFLRDAAGPNDVPEPHSLLLVALGLLAVGVTSRRRLSVKR